MKKLFSFVTVAIVMALSCVTASASTPPGPLPETSTITVHVVDSKGISVKGAHVTVNDASGDTDASGFITLTSVWTGPGDEAFAKSGTQIGSVVLMPYFEPAVTVTITLGVTK